MSLEALKSVLAGLVLILALFQGLEMAQIRGKIPTLFPAKRQTLRRWHRGGGVLALTLLIVIGLLCIFGEGTHLYSSRLWLHAIAGSLAILALLVKVVITYGARRLLRVNDVLGGLVGLLVLIAFLASVVGYYLF